MVAIISTIISFYVVLVSYWPQRTIIEGVVGQPQNLSPLLVGTNSVDRDLVSLIFRGLMRYGDNGEIETDLAEKYTISADQKEYTFNLGKGVLFHDGVEFTSDDVIYTASEHPQLRQIQVDKLERYKVRFVLRNPYAPFLDLLTLGIVPAHLGKSMKSLSPIGTGDYRLARVKNSNKIEAVYLVPSPFSEIKKPLAYPRIVFKFYDRADDLITAARLGEVDSFALEGKNAKLDNYYEYHRPLGSRFYAIFFNLKGREELKNKELRQDIAHSIDKNRIIDEVFAGQALASDYPGENGFASSSAIKRYEFKESLSRKYDLNLNLVVPKKDSHLKTAEIIKEQLEKIGVRLSIGSVELEKITPEIIGPKRFELLLLGQEVERDPDVYSFWHSTQENLPGLNFVGFENVLADKALEEGRQTINRDERIRHYQNFQKVFIEELPAIFLYRPILTYSIRKSLRGIKVNEIFKSEDRLKSLIGRED